MQETIRVAITLKKKAVLASRERFWFGKRFVELVIAIPREPVSVTVSDRSLVSFKAW